MNMKLYLALLIILSNIAIADENSQSSAITPVNSQILKSNEALIIGHGQLKDQLGGWTGYFTVPVTGACPALYNQMPVVNISIASFGPERNATAPGHASSDYFQVCSTKAVFIPRVDSIQFLSANLLIFSMDIEAYQTEITYTQKWDSGAFDQNHHHHTEVCEKLPINVSVNYTITCIPNR